MTDEEIERARIAEERRQLMAKPIPAKPKGSPLPGAPTPPPPLDDLLKQRQGMRSSVGEAAGVYEPKFAMAEPVPGSFEPFHDFVDILKVLRKYPKATQQHMIKALHAMLD